MSKHTTVDLEPITLAQISDLLTVCGTRKMVITLAVDRLHLEYVNRLEDERLDALLKQSAT
jgi:hypothetical protein